MGGGGGGWNDSTDVVYGSNSNTEQNFDRPPMKKSPSQFSKPNFSSASASRTKSSNQGRMAKPMSGHSRQP